jgi:hypothetical protein
LKHRLKLWVDYRRKRFWAVVAFVIYTLSGFFILPMVMKNTLVDLLADRLGRTLQIEQIHVNPFNFQLVFEALQLNDTDDVALVRADLITINLETSGLFLGALRFKEVRLDKPYLYLERFSTDSSRLSNLLADWQASAATETVESEADSAGSEPLPSFLVDSFTINAGEFNFYDRVPDEPVDFNFTPIDINVSQLSSLPDRIGKQVVRIEVPGDSVIEWQGNLTVSPLSSAGRVVTQSKLARSPSYLKMFLPISDFSGDSALEMNYSVSYTDELNLKIDDLKLQFSDISIQGLQPSSEFLKVANLSMQGGYIRYPQQEIGFSAVAITSPSLRVNRFADGTVDLSQLVAPSQSTVQNQNSVPAKTDADWSVMIDLVEMKEGALAVLDETTQPAASLEIDNLNFEVRDIQNSTTSSSGLTASLNIGEMGLVKIQGAAAILPELKVELDVTLATLPLVIVDPYLNAIADVRLDSGAVSAQLQVVLAGSKMSIFGSSALDDLAVIDERNSSKLLGWKKLSVDKFEYIDSPPRLHVSSIVVNEPFTKFEIYPDLSTNIESILKAPEVTTNAAAETDLAKPLQMTFAYTTINQATLDFSDLSLPLPFRTVTTNLSGTIGAISSFTSEPADIQMEGKVDEFGLSRMNGKLNLFEPTDSMDLVIEFRNLLMTSLSPYSAAFAGRAIEQGKLNLNLNYVINEGELLGSNELLLSEFKLGEKVDSPDAVSLPLDLAVALLTNSAGEIDIELPISGDVNDPEFHIGGVVQEALKQFLAKIVTAPFRMLGGLIGVQSDDLGEIKFLGGRSSLSPPELEQLGSISKAMEKRPDLSLIIPGVYDDRLDIPVLRYEKLVVKVRAQLNLESETDAKELMLDDSVLSVFEALSMEADPDMDLASLKAGFVKPIDEGKERLDQVAYMAELRHRLESAESVSVEELQQLARQRQTSILETLSQAGVPSEQIGLGEIMEVDLEAESEDDWVSLILEVSAG